MIDDIFEIEIVALAHVACASKESGVLLRDVAVACMSWCQSLLDLPCTGKKQWPEFICRFLRRIQYDSSPRVEFCRNDPRAAQCERRMFLVCDGFRLSMASRRDHSKEPAGLDFLQPEQHTHVDDFAVVASSFRGSMTVSGSFLSISGPCCWAQSEPAS